MAGITTAIENVFSVVSSTLSCVMENPALSMFFVAGLIGIGAGILSRLKSI